jgi:invasion protein IalB
MNMSHPMSDRSVFRALAVRRVVAAAALTAAAAIAVAPSASAQQPPAPKTQPKTQPKGPPAPPGQPQPPQGEQPPLTYTPWTKVCQKGGEDPKAGQICFIGRDGRVESGMPVVAAVLIVPEGQPKKVMRVTLPLGMAIQPGTRAIVDDGQPMTAPYVLCFTNGCMADYEASEELIGKLKKGKNLHVQGINGSGQPVSLPLPLADFAKAYDGPPTDPKTLAPAPKQ